MGPQRQGLRKVSSSSWLLCLRCHKDLSLQSVLFLEAGKGSGTPAMTSWGDNGIANPICFFFFFSKILFIYLEGGEGKEKNREKNINVWLPLTCPLLRTWPTTQACALTGNQTGNPFIHRPMLSLLSYTSQGPNLLFGNVRD